MAWWDGGRLQDAIAWTVVHFLWLGLLIGAITLWGLRSTREPDQRHAICIGALGAMLLGAVVTFWIALDSGAQLSASQELLSTLTLRSQEHRSMIAAGWLLGCGFFLARIGFGAVRLTWLRHSMNLTPSAEVMSALAGLSKRAGLSRIPELIVSHGVSSPATFGILRHAILLPASVATKLSLRDLEAVLAHELAHVLRRDCLANLLQCLAESLLFFHPVVWIISRQARIERELSCDAMAARWIGSKVEYAQALLNVECARRMPAPAVGVSTGSLRDRISFLAEWSGEARPARTLAVRALAVCLMAATLMGAMWLGNSRKSQLATTLMKPMSAVPTTVQGFRMIVAQPMLQQAAIATKTVVYEFHVANDGVPLPAPTDDMELSDAPAANAEHPEEFVYLMLLDDREFVMHDGAMIQLGAAVTQDTLQIERYVTTDADVIVAPIAERP